MVERMSDGILVPQYLPIKGPTAKERAAKVMPTFPPVKPSQTLLGHQQIGITQQGYLSRTDWDKRKTLGMGYFLHPLAWCHAVCRAEISTAAGVALQFLGNAPNCSVSLCWYRIGRSSQHCMNSLPFPEGGPVVSWSVPWGSSDQWLQQSSSLGFNACSLLQVHHPHSWPQSTPMVQPPLRLGTFGVQIQPAQFQSFVRHQERLRRAAQQPMAYPEGCRPRCPASRTCSLLPLPAAGHAQGRRAESGGGFLFLAWL